MKSELCPENIMIQQLFRAGLKIQNKIFDNYFVRKKKSEGIDPIKKDLISVVMNIKC